MVNALNALFWLSEELSPLGAMFDGFDPPNGETAMGYSLILET